MALHDAALKDLLHQIDANLSVPGRICLIGSGATILLGQAARQTDDIDMWTIASDIPLDHLQQAVEASGIAFDPKDAFPQLPCLQLVHPGIVQVPGWNSAKREWLGEPERIVWQGTLLTITVPSNRALVASKMLRGDDRDFEDCLWLIASQRLATTDILPAIRALPRGARQVAKDNFSVLGMMRTE